MTRAAVIRASRWGALVALLAAALLPAAASAQRRFRYYTVEPGDSCWSIATQLFGKGEQYSVIHRFNDLGPMPHLLKPGQQLRLPLAGTAPDARINWVQRAVKAKAPFMVDWRKARRDMGLWKLYKVSTGADSRAGILFEDRSSLRMRAKALLVIYGKTATRGRLKRRVKTHLMVEEGTVKGGLARLDKAAALSIQTPSSRVTLRSRSAQVEVDKRKTSSISVYDGSADVAAQGAKVSVPKDHGTYVIKGKRPAPPRPLPPAPTWSVAGDVVVFVPPGTPGRFEGSWAPVAKAARYRFELARDRAFRFPVVDALVGAGIRSFRAQDLKPATYYARVAAIDRWRLEGATSKLRTITVLPLRASRRLTPTPTGWYEAVGMLRLDLRGARGQAVEVSLDGGPFSTATIVRLRRPGDHVIRTRLRGAGVVTTLKVRLLAIRAQLAAPSRASTGATTPLRLSLVDAHGRPASPPGLRLEVKPAGALELAPVSAGVYQARWTPAAAGPVQIVARWTGGELARHEVQVEGQRRAEPVKPRPRAAVRPPPPGALPLEWSTDAPALPGRAARPRTRLAVASHITERAQDDGRDPLYLRLAASGELSLMEGRLGLDLTLPWFSSDLNDDLVGGSDLGDLRLGARWVALDRARWALSPSLRLTLPTGGHARPVRQTQLEPALLGAWRPWSRLVLFTNQILALQTDFDGIGVTYAALLGGAVRAWRGLELGLELDALFRLKNLGDGGRAAGIGAGGMIGWRFSRVRVALTGGAGLTESGRQLLGNVTAGVTIELLLGGR